MRLHITKERWAQIGITIQFLVLVRTLAEFFRLEYVQGAQFTIAVGKPYVIGALAAVISCWISVTLCFWRYYASVVCVTVATVTLLFVYKLIAIGW